MDRDELTDLARRWYAVDPDPFTRGQLTAALRRDDIPELGGLFEGRIEFGTAGLRAAVGPGPNRMNRLVVRQASAGIARELLGTVEGCRRRGVVVAHDARHGSADFAREAIKVIGAHGIDIHVFDEPVPTPLLAFAVGHLHAAAGVMITASHNPATDNGMKVYWEDGAQIIPPTDQRIAQRIMRVSSESLAQGEDTSVVTRSEAHPVNVMGGAGTDDPVVHDYVRHAIALVGPARERSLRIATTALHGVGSTLLHRVLADAGFDDLHTVESQTTPDPDFPSVEFPNPEEPGALDALIDLAERIDADVGLANDPDADRLAAVFRGPSGSWRALQGDELGAVLAERLITLSNTAWSNTAGRAGRRLMATTVVSSRLCARIAEAAGVEFHETLTGFKWLCRPGLADPDVQQLLLYEEALGYAIGGTTRDKDGITAALVMADLASHLKTLDRTIWTVLDDLALRHGAHVQLNESRRVAGDSWRTLIDSAVDSLLRDLPRSVAGHEVVHTDLPAPDVVRLFLDDETRVVVRPSGTEPKIKLYSEAIEAVSADPDEARAIARERLDGVNAAMWSLLGL